MQPLNIPVIEGVIVDRVIASVPEPSMSIGTESALPLLLVFFAPSAVVLEQTLPVVHGLGLIVESLKHRVAGVAAIAHIHTLQGIPLHRVPIACLQVQCACLLVLGVTCCAQLGDQGQQLVDAGATGLHSDLILKL